MRVRRKHWPRVQARHGRCMVDCALRAGRAQMEKVRPVDEILPLPQLFLFGLQHVLVMAASPITAAFLVSRALNFTPELTLNLISATFLICGLGTLLQSFGPLGFG